MPPGDPRPTSYFRDDRRPSFSINLFKDGPVETSAKDTLNPNLFAYIKFPARLMNRQAPANSCSCRTSINFAVSEDANVPGMVFGIMGISNEDGTVNEAQIIILPVTRRVRFLHRILDPPTKLNQTIPFLGY